MARREVVVLTSDLTGEEIEPGDGRTIEFRVDGGDYKLDLTHAEADQFDRALKPYVLAATTVGGKRSSTTPSGRGGRSREELSNIREWAKANGYDVSERGRISQKVREAYHAAH